MSASKYILIDSRKLHFYVMGSGPAIVLLHPSPHNSEMLLPMAEKLAEHYTVFAIDTPGYGKSDALGFEPKSLNDYTKFLHKAFVAMGLEKPALYGSATGAQIAIRYALEYPNAVSHLFIDNAAHFDDALCDAILEHYFPDLTPKLDGSHLDEIWNMVSHMFQYFPWCFATEAYALNRQQLPPAALHFIAMDYLKAGANYHYAYKVAFKHERGRYVQQLKIPTTIFKWNGSIIAKYIDDLLVFEFPSHVSPFVMDGDPAQRMEVMTNFMNEKISESKSYSLSKHIATYVEDAKIIYKSKNKPSQINDDGAYLKEAWDTLVKDNPELNAEQIQSCLVDWYS